jgi:adenosylmethionine-8-amino-7-oxononanoate aminotransferase
MIGLELVVDRDTKATFPPERHVWHHILEAGLELGLVCYPMGGTVDGKRGDHILLAPAFTYSGAHVDEMLDKLGRAVDIGIDRALRA